MCTHIKDFYNSNKYAIWWTVGYVIAAWAIMRYMFNFNIFSALRWHQLMHAHLHGFAGLVFGILILAMIPLYVATTVVIARTKSPLFNFNLTMPTFIKNAFIQTPMDDPKPNPEPQPEPAPDAKSEPQNESATTPTEPEPNQPAPSPENIPAELRVAYARARDNISRTQPSAFDLGNVTMPSSANTPTPTPQSESTELPIPTDFDIADTANIIGDVPVFTDLDFDDDDDENEDYTEPSSQTNDVQSVTDDNDMVIKYLTAKSVPHTTDGDVVITNQFAIVSHTDSDFWVADNESWFAAGKIRKSPIESVLAAATAHNVQPVLYMGADNIMDIDDLRDTWQRAGIRIITNLKDLK